MTETTIAVTSLLPKANRDDSLRVTLSHHHHRIIPPEILITCDTRPSHSARLSSHRSPKGSVVLAAQIGSDF